MACDPLISDPFLFPQRAYNRPGLPRIAYRIGRYADFLEAMARGIDRAPELGAWTHREPDDPGIAILEGAAILGDILTFYQEHYANEAFLRTAAWRESVAELVRLTGYRLAPGMGGRATLAFEARGNTPLVIPGQFAVKADLKDVPAPVDMETDSEVTVWPHLGRFNLYRPRIYPPVLAAGAATIEVATVDGASDSISMAAAGLKAGEQLMLLPGEPSWTSSGNMLTEQQSPQVVKIKAVTHLLGRVVIDLDAPIAESWPGPVVAHRVNRTFRHAGHNAPPVVIKNVTDSAGKIIGSSESATFYRRHVDGSHACTNTSAEFALGPTVVPLDTEVADLTAGQRLIIQTVVAKSGQAPVAVSLLRTIRALHARTFAFGNLTVAGSVVTLDRGVVSHAMDIWPESDVRDYRILEVTGPALTIRPLSAPANTAFVDGSNAVCFWGTAVEARALVHRRLHVFHSDGRSVDLVCTNGASSFVASGSDVPRMWDLTFDRRPSPFTRADFDEAEPTVTVFGNLVEASQGKSEREAVLGNGDHRTAWQTFVLPKSPLTYLLSPGESPPQIAELEVWVDDRLWTRVDAFYGHGPTEQVYIIREDSEGRSFIQFGDGETGARLPSGLKNIVARFRTGVGARGPVKPNTNPSPRERPAGFHKVSIAGIVAGGADAEDREKAREAAPGKIQSLGRLVTIRDYETETLAVPGVLTAVAAWDLHAGVPAVVLRVLLELGREAEFEAVRRTLAHAQRCHGPDRFPLIVEQARFRFVFLDVSYARDPGHRQDRVDADLRMALGLVGVEEHARSGLFGRRARRLGQREYASTIEGRLQNVPGVLWCKVTALGRFHASVIDPTAIQLPPTPRQLATRLACGPRELLQLSALHLTLTEVSEPTAGECS